MNDLPLAVTDLVVLGVIFLSGFLAYFRGAVREFFFLATWAGAALATVYLYHVTFPMVAGWVGGDPLIAALANTAGLFVIALTLMTLVSTVAVRRAESSRLNVLDRSLGFVFGLVRGVFLVCLVYLAYTLLSPVEEHPAWLREARLTPLIARGTGAMISLVPEEWGLPVERFLEQAKDASSAVGTLGDYEDLINPQPQAPESGNSPEEGYNEEDRSLLDGMIDSDE